jgi:uncharacterized phage protein gp47/JayE
MAFQIKNFRSIAAAMLNFAKATQAKATDFYVGGVTRTVLESSAIEIDELYQQMFHGLMESIPVAVYQGFGFDLLPPAYASTVMQFSASPAPVDPITIPAGTLVRKDGGAVAYAVEADTVLPAGETSVPVPVTAATAGSVGNTLANSITVLDGAISGITAVTNPAPVTNGRDQETEEERRLRFRRYIQSLSRGPLAAIEYGATTAALLDAYGVATEYVASAAVVEWYKTHQDAPYGLVYCYLWNGSNGASPELITLAQQIIDGYVDGGGQRVMGYKAAGIQVVVMATTTSLVNVTGTLVPREGYASADLIPLATTAIGDYITALPTNTPFVREAAIASIMNIPGVHDFTMSLPATNLNPVPDTQGLPFQPGQLAVKYLPGAITIT